MLRRILVALDHSAQNQYVFETAVSLARATDAALMLLHILDEDIEAELIENSPQIPNANHYSLSEEGELEFYQDNLASYQNWSWEILGNFAQHAEQAGVRTEFSQTSGDPERVICEVAKTWSADLIVLGTRGLTGLQAFFLGSVSNYVTRHAPCSVYLVRNPGELG